jgi:hypothetical protein
MDAIIHSKLKPCCYYDEINEQIGHFERLNKGFEIDLYYERLIRTCINNDHHKCLGTIVLNPYAETTCIQNRNSFLSTAINEKAIKCIQVLLDIISRCIPYENYLHRRDIYQPGNEDILLLVLNKYRHHINKIGMNGYTPLMVAISVGSITGVKRLLNCDADKTEAEAFARCKGCNEIGDLIASHGITITKRARK